MPFYEYECENCKFYLEVLQKISDAPLRKCPSCGKSQLKKLISAPVFRLKGGGWYETDFKSDKEGKRNLAVEKEADSAPSDKAADTKADAKEGAAASAGASGGSSGGTTPGSSTAAPPSASKDSTSKAAESRRSPAKVAGARSRSVAAKPRPSAKPKSKPKSPARKRR
jgi:putative FmdB family regulatory protein